MTTVPEEQQGTVLLVWHAEDGFSHIDPNTNHHEVTLWRNVIHDALSAARDEPTTEQCGYLQRVDDDLPWVSVRAVRVDNVAKAGEFAFPDEAVLEVYDLMERGDCLGLWHTHPNGSPNPSPTDWQGHPRDVNVPMYIVALDQDLPQGASVNRYTEDDRP